MKRIFINNGFFRILFPIVYGIIVYLLILLINNSIGMLNESFLTQEVYISIILTYLVMESNRLLIKVTEKYTLFLEKIGGTIIILIISSTVLSIIVVSLLISAYFNYVIGFTNFSSELTYFNIIFLVIFLLLGGLALWWRKKRTTERSKLVHMVEMLRKTPDTVYVASAPGRMKLG